MTTSIVRLSLLSVALFAAAPVAGQVAPPRSVTRAPEASEAPRPVTRAARAAEAPRSVTRAPRVTEEPRPVTRAPRTTEPGRPVTRGRTTDPRRPVTPAPQAPAAPAAAPAPFAIALPAATPAFPQLPSLGGPATGEREVVAPEPWLPRDPGDSLYRAAREALNQRRFGRADTLFAEIRVRFPESGYAADSYYFQAFALQRLGGREREERALALLTEQRSKFPRAATLTDAGQLTLRIQGALAQIGVAAAAVALEQVARTVQEIASVQAPHQVPAEQVAQSPFGWPSEPPANCDADELSLRATALSALVSVDKERAATILGEILKTRDECSGPLRRQALLLAARIGGDEIVSNMLDVALNDPDADVRAAAVSWLGRSESSVAEAAIEQILRETSDRRIQEQALEGLGKKKTAAAIESLKSFVARKDAPIELRAQAISWIGRDAENGGTAYLRGLYPSLDDATLRQQVFAVLSRSEAEEDRAWLRARVMDTNESPVIRRFALGSAMRAGLKVAEVRPLYAEMEDPDLRLQLIAMIQRSNDPEAVDFMIDLALKEKDRALRQDAILWLGRSKDPRAADFLLKVVKGETQCVGGTASSGSRC